MPPDFAPPPATLTGLAAALGLGKSTVHRALTGSPLVAPATRERVFAAAAAAGYRRDPYFAALVSHRRKHSGRNTVTVHYLRGSPVNSRFKQGYDCLPELREEGVRLGLDVQPVDLCDFPRWNSMLRVLYHRGCRGLLVEQVDPVLHDMIRDFGRLPVVCCERQEGLPFHTVRHAVSDRVRLCWQKLREAGYHRIGFALYVHRRMLNDDRDRLATALFLQELAPDTGRVPILRLEHQEKALDEDSYRAWLSCHRPEAVVSFTSGLWHAGLGHPRCPRALVSLHAGTYLPVPGAMHASRVFAREAIALLDREIRLGEVGRPELPIDVVIPPLWHQGDGIPPATTDEPGE